MGKRPTSICKTVGLWCAAGLLLLAMLSVGGAAYLQSYALKASGNPRGKDIEGAYAYMQQTYPWITAWTDSLQTCQGLRDTFIYTDDGIRLHALYAEAPHPTPYTAVIVHGYTDNAVRMLHIGYVYHHDLQCNILLPDLRFSGLSDGNHLQMGWLDRCDVRRWIHIAHERFSGPKGEARMVVHGISMGAATVMCVSGEPTPPYVHCFVEDCGYTDVWDEFKVQLHDQFGLPPFPLLYAADGLTYLRYGWSFRQASARKQLARCQRPMFFIHGNSDTFVPSWMGDSLFAAHPGIKALWKPAGVQHATAYRDYPAEYTSRVKAFVDRHLFAATDTTLSITPIP